MIQMINQVQRSIGQGVEESQAQSSVPMELECHTLSMDAFPNPAFLCSFHHLGIINY